MPSSNHCAHIFAWYSLRMEHSDTMSDAELFTVLGDALMYLTASH